MDNLGLWENKFCKTKELILPSFLGSEIKDCVRVSICSRAFMLYLEHFSRRWSEYVAIPKYDHIKSAFEGLQRVIKAHFSFIFPLFY